MSKTRNYKLENKLIELCESGVPDFDKLRKLIEQGADVNATSEEEFIEGNVLASILMGFWGANDWDEKKDKYSSPRTSTRSGKTMVSVVKFFLDNGFNVKGNNGKNGAQCLSALVLSSFDRYMLVAAKMLFDAGARDGVYSNDDDETAKNRVGAEGSYQDCCAYNHPLANIFEAFYQMFEAIEQGRPYDGIDSFELAEGKRITKVLADKPESGDVFFDLDVPGSGYKNCYTSNLYFIYDGGMLVTTQFADYWTDTYLPKTELVDVSDRFNEVVGHTIKEMVFYKNGVQNGTTHSIQPTTYIVMDNGQMLRTTINFGEVEDKDRAAYYQILDHFIDTNKCEDTDDD